MKDPVRWDGGQSNLFVHVGNDPVNATDRVAAEKRVVGLVLLNGGVITLSLYALTAGAVSFIDDAHLLGRLRGIIYISGLAVVPAALVLLVAGGSVLFSRKPCQSKDARRT